MEDMATGEIRLSILWEWLHKNAALTADDDAVGVKAGDRFTPELFARLLAEEYEKLLQGRQPRRARRLEDHDAADRARDRRNLRRWTTSSCRGTSTCSTSPSRITTWRKPSGASACLRRRFARTARGSRRIWTGSDQWLLRGRLIFPTL